MEKLENLTDEQILVILANDEDRAVELFFRKYYGYLCNVVYRILPDAALSEDLAQDVFFEFWKKRESLKIQTSARAYLKRAAINKSLNYIRDRKMRFSDEEELPKQASLDQNSQQNLEVSELKDQIQQSIDLLPERCRLIFMLSRFEEMSYQQIADELDISIKTVENQISKALKFLRKNLAPFVGKGPLLWFLVQLF